MTFLRAHGEEQKQIRVQQIADATAKLYDEIGYDKVTFSKIGKSVNFSRINLYNYFTCKEDVFLLILLRDIKAMVDDAELSLTKVYTDEEEFIDKWTDVIMRHQRMLALLGIVNTVILRDATSENHKSFRINMFEHFKRLGRVFMRVLPCLNEHNINYFIDFENSYAMTIYPASREYKESQHIEVFAEAGYGTASFAPQYKRFLRTVIAGIHKL